MMTFPSAPITCSPHRKASASPKSQPSSSDAKTQLLTFLKSPKSSALASSAWHHSHPPVTFSIWGFYFDISEWHVRPARAWTPVFMLHLSNPCTKWKVLSLTKPKGKIYKTKSLCHYITLFIHIHQIHMIFKHIFWITFLNEPELIFSTKLNGFTYYLITVKT